MRTNQNHYSTLKHHLVNVFLDSPDVMHPAESYALAHGLCRHFELDVSPVDILHAIVMAEELVQEYLEAPYQDDWEEEAEALIPF